MILFINDWLKYPTAIPDFTSTNTTFVRMAGMLKKMGVKNNLFILTLLDQDLKGVDPHSDNLSNKVKLKIGLETKKNPWYYFREVAIAPSVSGVVKNHFQANRFNIALIWSFFNHVTTFGIAPRQTGKSFAVDTLMVGLLSFWTMNTDINLLTKDSKLRSANVNRIKAIQASLPPYLIMKSKTDLDNSEAITVDMFGNTYTTHIGRASEKDAEGTGRGLTSPIIQGDEVCFINNVHVTLPVMLGIMGAAVDAAKASNSPYGVVFTSTAGNKGSKSGAFFWDIYTGGKRWNERLYDCRDEEELHLVVEKGSSGIMPILILEFNHRQLGKTDAWLSSRMKLAMASGENGLADFLNVWGKGSGSSPISKEVLDELHANKSEPKFVEISPEGYTLNWYKTESELKGYINRPMVIGLDTSDAVGNDGMGLIIRDVKTGAVLAAGNYNETNVIKFIEFLYGVMKRYTKSILIPEAKSSGYSMLDKLKLLMLNDGIDPFKRIFNWVVDESNVKEARFDEIITHVGRRDESIYDKYKKEFGFGTSSGGRASRDKLYGAAFSTSVKYSAAMTYDPTLIQQLSTITIRNNRVDHAAGGHDDLVIAFMLTWWFLTEAKNLEFYGISNTEPLSGLIIKTESVQDDVIRNQHIEYDNVIKLEIENLFNTISKDPNNYMRVQIIIRRIRQLSLQLVNSGSNTLNINTRLNELSYMNVE